MVFVLAGLGEFVGGAEATQAVPAGRFFEPDEAPLIDPEYPDERALVLAIAALLEAQ